MKLLNANLWRSRSIVLTVLSIFLGSFFMLMGAFKLSPSISVDIHRELRRNFIQFSKLGPFSSYLGWKISPRCYRTIWGYLEVIMGATLVLIPFPKAKIIANLTLMVMTTISIYNNYCAGHKFDRIAPCIVFSLMLACRLIVEYQVHRREKLAKRDILRNRELDNRNDPLINNHRDDGTSNDFQNKQIKAD